METILQTIQLNEYQADFLAWCNKHHHQLVDLRKSKALENGGSSFTTHLKDEVSIGVPPIIDHIDLHGKYYPK